MFIVCHFCAISIDAILLRFHYMLKSFGGGFHCHFAVRQFDLSFAGFSVG